jgi:hypothetical protein
VNAWELLYQQLDARLTDFESRIRRLEHLAWLLAGASILITAVTKLMGCH